MKKCLFLLFSLLLSLSAYAQQEAKIRGRVLDRKGMPIYGAAVMAYRHEKKHGLKITDSEGDFTIDMGNPQDTVMIDFISLEPVMMRYSDFFVDQINTVVFDEWGPLYCEEIFRSKTKEEYEKQTKLVAGMPLDELRQLIWERRTSAEGTSTYLFGTSA